MGKKRNKQRQKGGDSAAGEEANDAAHAPVVVLATQPNGPCVAVAHDKELWLLDCSNASLIELEDSTFGAPIRAVAFDPTGNLLLTGGDDKTVRVWQLDSRQLLHKWVVPKKVSAAAFSADGSFAFFADKFGDVHVAATAADATAGPKPLLGHFCSIITDLAASPDGKFVVSTDRDSKTRGAHEIQSYCLGHTSFVTACAFVATPEATLLASASGDGTVRLWDHVSGQLLDTCHVPVPPGNVVAASTEQADTAEEAGTPEVAAEEAGALNLDSAPSSAAEMELGDVPASGSGYESDDEDNGEENAALREHAAEPATAATLALAASPSGRHLATLVEGQDEVTILEVDAAARKLSICQRLAMHDLALPNSVQFDRGGRIWAVGRPRLEESGALKVGVAALNDAGTEFESAAEDVVPDALRAALRTVANGGQAAQTGALGQVNPQLRKRVYTEAETDFRKRNRRDIKAASTAAAASIY
ncbi:YVTN repeat-like/Quino protein amine dehydrogenase [Coccomyxa subellipsoidea C-169]|uniref:YVTN repeat-like/Quino protein amine dehydrogenase n=1 Tax=Coccomyxa subellipsoidea (strain C-169) TaxID=574566 RepID=I0YU36_COCSC|nr:YVTN repeat-like/Quino protein amine dehydrogenase [Coccomyxa subellipsoidea C-169]EIE21905.1 YVTN repeat-like/Quino protein amine dehydrogenase [Coccomyxa subellipsoidea C-169]|eukprot:XP_005646449.1 YVTN repeat-like/Quino protein amine dehydrogenase [Coccomyxa subellipsoidea C-169]